MKISPFYGIWAIFAAHPTEREMHIFFVVCPSFLVCVIIVKPWWLTLRNGNYEIIYFFWKRMVCFSDIDSGTIIRLQWELLWRCIAPTFLDYNTQGTYCTTSHMLNAFSSTVSLLGVQRRNWGPKTQTKCRIFSKNGGLVSKEFN